MRFLSAKQPKLITYNLHHVNTNTFVVKEEMGFEDHEVKQLLLAKPRMWMLSKCKGLCSILTLFKLAMGKN